MDRWPTASNAPHTYAVLLIEVRDSRTGYLVPRHDGPGLLPDWESSWEFLGRRRRRRRRHLEVEVDIQARKLCLEFSNWILTHMGALGILIPGFDTGIRAGLI